MRFPFRTIRWAHGLLALPIGAFVYSPTLRELPNYVLLVQFVIFPLIVFGGLALWIGPKIWRALFAPPRRSPQA